MKSIVLEYLEILTFNLGCHGHRGPSAVFHAEQRARGTDSDHALSRTRLTLMNVLGQKLLKLKTVLQFQTVQRHGPIGANVSL